MKFLIKTIITALAILVSDLVLSGVHVEGFWWAIVLALVLSFLNSVVRPLLIILTLPATLVTLGLFLLVINAIIIELADWIIGAGFQVESFIWALLFSFVLSIVNSVFEGIDKDKNKDQKGNTARIEN